MKLGKSASILSPDQNSGGDDATFEAATSENSEEGEENIAALREQLAIANSKATENYDRLLRTAADFENSRKRWERERQDVRIYACQEFAKDLLPVIDAFDKAISAIDEAQLNFETEDGKKMGAIVEGIRLVSKTFLDSLKKHGIEKVPGKGQPFDPQFHNAVAKVVDDSVKQETVADEFVPGYKIGDRVLRTAMVRVVTPE